MQTWIALFRGINVGGNHILPMKKLVADLEQLNLKHIRTYIQSGNVVFDSAAKSRAGLAKKISGKIEEVHGFRPKVFLLSSKELQDAVDGNPFMKEAADPKTVHFSFLESAPSSPDISGLTDALSQTEKFRLTDHVFYLYAPDGIGRSKIAAKAEKLLGVVTTGRNYRTVEKLLAMVTKS